MDSSLKIRSLIFDEQGISLLVQRAEDGEYFHYLVSQLFNSIEQRDEFNPADSRLIGYFAAVEEYQSDQNFLQKCCLKMAV